jgi:hypothetical protein
MVVSCLGRKSTTRCNAKLSRSRHFPERVTTVRDLERITLMDEIPGEIFTKGPSKCIYVIFVLWVVKTARPGISNNNYWLFYEIYRFVTMVY